MIAQISFACLTVLATAAASAQTCKPYWVRPGVFPALFADYYSTVGKVFNDGTGSGLFVVGYRSYVPGMPSGTRFGLFRYRGGSWQEADQALPPRDEGLGQAIWDIGDGPQHMIVGSTAMTPGVSRAPLANIFVWRRFRTEAALAPVPSDLGDNTILTTNWNDGTGTTLYRARSNFIERYRDGAWQPIGQNLGGNTLRLTVADDGTGPTLVAAGYFSLGSTPSSNYATIIKWTGFGWLRLASSYPFNPGDVRAIASYDSGNGPELYVAGSIRPLGVPGGPETYGIVKWDGEQWTDVGGGITTGLIRQINVLKVWDDGNGPKLYACGWVGGMGGQNTIGIAAWDGQRWSTVSTGLHGIVTSLSEMDDPRGRLLFAVGDINAVAGQSPVVLQLVGCPNCYVDCDADGRVTASDFVCFLNAYARQDPLANCDGDAVLSPADFACYQARYAEGCPGWTGWPPRP